MAEKNYYYYDVSVINNSLSDDFKLNWNDNKNNSIIRYNPDNKYSMMINELIIDTDSIMLFQFKPNTYSIKIINTALSIESTQILTFDPPNDSIYPNKNDYRQTGIYYIYQFLRILNRSVQDALLACSYAVTDLFFQYDPDTKMFFLVKTTSLASLDIQFNSNLIYLFCGFMSKKIDAEYWSIIMDDTINRSGTITTYSIYRQEYSSNDNFRQVASINVYLNNNLNITNTITYTYDFNQLNFSENKERSQLLLKVFYPEINDLNNRVKLFYRSVNYPTGMKNIESKSLNQNSFSRLGFGIFIEMSTGEELPLYMDRSSHMLAELVIEETLG